MFHLQFCTKQENEALFERSLPFIPREGEYIEYDRKYWEVCRVSYWFAKHTEGYDVTIYLEKAQ